MTKSMRATFLPKLHFDPKRRIYAVSEHQLRQLETIDASSWKDSFLVSISVFAPTFLYTISEIATQSKFQPTVPLFIGSVIAGISLILSLIFGLLWFKSNKTTTDIFKEIRDQPCFELEVLLPGDEELGDSDEIMSVGTASLVGIEDSTGSKV